jgi:hypothetical protein
MKAIVILVVMMIISNDISEARNILPRKYLRNVNKSVNKHCIYKAYNITQNTEVFNCLNSKIVTNCNNLINFTEFNDIKTECINGYQSEILKGMLIAVLIWIIIILLSAK